MIKLFAMLFNILFIILGICDLIYLKKTDNTEDRRYIRILLKMKLLAIIIFVFIYLLGCAPKVKYVVKPLTKPPERYEPGIITNTQQELLEYTKAIFTIARWQNWYNSQVGTNYYHYYNYSNYLYNKPKETENTNLIILSNDNTNKAIDVH